MDESRYGTGVIFVGGIQILLTATLLIGGWLYPPPDPELVGVDGGLWYVLFGGGMLLLRLGFLLRGDYLQLTDEAEDFPRSSLVFEAYTLAFIAILGAGLTLIVYFG
jgi:hypothetical protein